MSKFNIQNKIEYFIVITIIFSLWFFLTENKLVSPIFLPKPLEIYDSFVLNIFNFTLIYDIFTTLSRVLISLLLSTLIGIPVGLLMGYYKRFYNFFELYIEFFRNIPTSALIPLFLLLFGIEDTSKIALAVWGSSYTIIINTLSGAQSITDTKIKIARIFKLSDYKIFTKILVYASLPQIFTGLRLALSLCFIIIIVTEMFIGSTDGLGQRIINSQLSYRIDEMYMTIIIVGIIGFLCNKILIYLENRIVHWKRHV